MQPSHSLDALSDLLFAVGLAIFVFAKWWGNPNKWRDLGEFLLCWVVCSIVLLVMSPFLTGVDTHRGSLSSGFMVLSLGLVLGFFLKMAVDHDRKERETAVSQVEEQRPITEETEDEGK